MFVKEPFGSCQSEKKYLPVLNASREVVIDRLINHIATAKSGNIRECNFPFGHSD